MKTIHQNLLLPCHQLREIQETKKVPKGRRMMRHNAEPQNLSEEGECGDCKEKDGEEKFQGFYPNQLLPNALENEESSDSETIPYKEDESEVDQQIEREPSVEEETLGQDERGG